MGRDEGRKERFHEVAQDLVVPLLKLGDSESSRILSFEPTVRFIRYGGGNELANTIIKGATGQQQEGTDRPTD
jgi:hypothetical protein